MSVAFEKPAIGLALSGGGPRGLAHIGVIKALEELGIQPVAVAGTSAGSIIGAFLAAGKGWREMAEIAAETKWVSLFNDKNLITYCEKHLPNGFEDLKLPYIAVAAEWKPRRAVPMREGKLSTAVAASCAIPGVIRAVKRDGKKLFDGGLACGLPSKYVRELGATFVISSDVMGISSTLRSVGLDPRDPKVAKYFPAQYREAVDESDILVCPAIPVKGMIPGADSLDKMIAAGEAATRTALAPRLMETA